MSRVFTVGHGTRTTEELATVLQSAGVGRLIDVRRFPGSRRHPHFSREALERSMPERGLRYEWWGEDLGGRRSRTTKTTRHVAWRNAGFQGYADYMDSDRFRAALERLAGRVPAAQAPSGHAGRRARATRVRRRRNGPPRALKIGLPQAPPAGLGVGGAAAAVGAGANPHEGPLPHHSSFPPGAAPQSKRGRGR